MLGNIIFIDSYCLMYGKHVLAYCFPLSSKFVTLKSWEILLGYLVISKFKVDHFNNEMEWILCFNSERNIN